MENKIRRKKLTLSILGNSQVGKTNLIGRYLGNIFQEDSLNTIGNERYTNEIEIDGEKFILKIYDTSGQERFRSTSIMVIKQSKIILLVYDVTNRKSFEELNYWVKTVEDNRNDNCIIGIVGNKIDLCEKIEVSEEEGIEFAKKNNFQFASTSAKSNIYNFNYLINNLIDEYFRKYPKEKEFISLEIQKEKKKKRKTCCQGEIYFPFGERFKARVLPWYIPMFEIREKKEKENSLI